MVFFVSAEPLGIYLNFLLKLPILSEATIDIVAGQWLNGEAIEHIITLDVPLYVRKLMRNGKCRV